MSGAGGGGSWRPDPLRDREEEDAGQERKTHAGRTPPRLLRGVLLILGALAVIAVLAQRCG